MSLKAPPLSPGDTIGIFAPSSYVEEQQINKACGILHDKDFKTVIHPQAFMRHNQSAGTAREKADAFHELLKNPEINAIFAAGGGNRALTMLPHIDYGLIRTHPKILLGYSDVSALLNAIYAETGLVTFHGPVVKEMNKRRKTDMDMLFALLGGETVSYDFSNCKALTKGEAEGPLIGGNLSVFHALIGTPYMPDLSGALLFLEDTGDQLSRYDRMLTHLSLSGALSKIAGLIIGDVSGEKDSGAKPFGLSPRDVVEDHTKGFDIPVIMHAPFGHGDNLRTLPVGSRAKLDTTKDSVTFALTERPLC